MEDLEPSANQHLGQTSIFSSLFSSACSPHKLTLIPDSYVFGLENLNFPSPTLPRDITLAPPFLV